MFPKSVLGISSPVPFPHGGRSRLSEVEKRKLDTECIQSGIPSYLAIRVIWRRLERREERTDDDDASIVFASCATSCRSQKVKFGHLFRRELKENSFQWSNNSRTSVLQSSEHEKRVRPPDGDEPKRRKNSFSADKYATYLVHVGRATVPRSGFERVWVMCILAKGQKKDLWSSYQVFVRFDWIFPDRGDKILAYCVEEGAIE